MDSLTPEQEALIPAYQEKWRKIALSTKPIDREKAAKAVKAAYELIGEEEPEIIFADSPYQASIALDWGYTQLDYQDLISYIKERLEIGLPSIEPKLDKQLFAKLQTMCHLLENGIQEKLYLEHRGMYVPDEFQPGYRQTDVMCFECSWFDFCITELNCKYNSVWEIYRQIIQECGRIAAYKETCFICDRPRILSFDNQNRLHAVSESGASALGSPAIQYNDGFSIYAYHGVRLPEKYGKLHPKEWRSQWLQEEKNAELRRVLIQGMGYDRIINELEATELDTYQEYTLLKIDSNLDREPIYLLKMTCPSTGHIHILRVPPDVTFAREAIRWVNWGVDPEEFSIQT